MKVKVGNITVFVLDSYEMISKRAAALVASQVNVKPKSILGLATGGTPVGMYKELVEMYQNDEVDFSEVRTFNLDEYYPIQPENEQSYAYYMNKNLFEHINIKKERIRIPNGATLDAEAECAAYDKAMDEAGGVDLQVLGIGNNGHIGFNEPNLHFETGTHVVELDAGTILANARFFASEKEVPRQAISMGIRNIMNAKKIVLLANGTAKAEIMEKMLFGEVSPKVPASVLQLHRDVTILMDKEAGARVLTHVK